MLVFFIPNTDAFYNETKQTDLMKTYSIFSLSIIKHIVYDYLIVVRTGVAINVNGGWGVTIYFAPALLRSVLNVNSSYEIIVSNISLTKV